MFSFYVFGLDLFDLLAVDFRRSRTGSLCQIREEPSGGRYRRLWNDQPSIVRSARGRLFLQARFERVGQSSGATVAVQGIISGTIDIYQGGTAAIAASLAGADIIYVAAAVDRNSLILFGQKGITSLENFRGKWIATTFPGAFGEIAIRMTARRNGMEA